MYDVIFVDAATANVEVASGGSEGRTECYLPLDAPAPSLCSVEALSDARSLLRPGGLLLLNVLSAHRYGSTNSGDPFIPYVCHYVAPHHPARTQYSIQVLLLDSQFPNSTLSIRCSSFSAQ